MVTSKDCFKKYGSPSLNEAKHMVMWNVPAFLHKGNIPHKVYCNRDMVEPLRQAFINLVTSGCYVELNHWGGCFNIRLQRGSNTEMSLHSWAIACDLNEDENQQGATPKLSREFVNCFKDAGFDWGGDFTRTDGMHFQLCNI